MSVVKEGMLLAMAVRLIFAGIGVPIESDAKVIVERLVFMGRESLIVSEGGVVAIEENVLFNEKDALIAGEVLFVKDEAIPLLIVGLMVIDELLITVVDSTALVALDGSVGSDIDGTLLLSGVEPETDPEITKLLFAENGAGSGYTEGAVTVGGRETLPIGDNTLDELFNEGNGA